MKDDEDVLKLIKNRRSVRSFKDESVSKEKIKKLIEAGIWAPSGSNIHAWNIKVVKGEVATSIKKFSPGLLGDPPILLVICSDKKEAEEKGGELAKEVLSVMDVAIAAQNICLEATALNLGSCYVRSFNQDAVQEILDLPQKVIPELIISIGVPEEVPNPPPRRDIEDATEWVGWKDE